MKREPHYLGVVYHDEPEDANTDSTTVGWFPSRRAAVAAVRRAMDEHWNALTATVHYGYVVSGDGGTPPYWEDDDTLESWLVTADSIERC